METATLATVISITAISIKIIDKLIDFILDKLNKDESLKKSDIKDALDRTRIDDIYAISSMLKQMHDVKDSDGIPLWYVPRSIQASQSEVISALSKISNSQESLVKVCDKISSVLENMGRQQQLMLFQIEKRDRSVN